MKDFDVDRASRLQGDRTFKIGGETFTYRPAVPPEALIRWADMTNETPETEAIKIIDETVNAFLSPGQEEKWTKVRTVDAENPLTAGDIIELIRWLVEEQTGRPTMPPSDSTTGSENGASTPHLTAVSSSTEAAE